MHECMVARLWLHNGVSAVLVQPSYAYDKTFSGPCGVHMKGTVHQLMCCMLEGVVVYMQPSCCGILFQVVPCMGG
jgi:hypothetical protein